MDENNDRSQLKNRYVMGIVSQFVIVTICRGISFFLPLKILKNIQKFIILENTKNSIYSQNNTL